MPSSCKSVDFSRTNYQLKLIYVIQGGARAHPNLCKEHFQVKEVCFHLHRICLLQNMKLLSFLLYGIYPIDKYSNELSVVLGPSLFGVMACFAF